MATQAYHKRDLYRDVTDRILAECSSTRMSANLDRYLIKNASFFSFRFFISSLIHRGVAPRPAQVSVGFALLLYLGGTLRPFMALTRRPRRPIPPALSPSLESCDLSSSAFRPS